MSFKGLPVVFDSLEWAELLGFLLDSFGGKNVERQKSYFSGKVGATSPIEASQPEAGKQSSKGAW